MPDINKAYTWAIQTCASPTVGYSQRYRNQGVVNGITHYDCSSFINYSLLAGGFSTPGYAPEHNAFTTAVLKTGYLTTLGFKEVSPNGIILPGDVGLNSAHTEMCYKTGSSPGYGVFMGAHTDNALLPYQVSIGAINGDQTWQRHFLRIFRYGNGADGAEIYGYSIYVVSAILGNFWQESGINPGIWEGLKPGNWTDLRKGFGLGQWTNVLGDTHGRLYQLHKYLSENGYEDDSGPGQAKFIVDENLWISINEASDFKDLQSFLNSTSTDIAYLTHAWCAGWEGIHDESWDLRVDYAKRVYDYISEHAQDSSITSWISGNRYISTTETLNNAVLFYREFSAGGGGGGFPTKKKKTMPAWMKIKYHI